jgi:hypothetical protein
MIKRAHDEKISRWEESGPTTQSAPTPSIDSLHIHTIWIIVFRLSPYIEQQLAHAQTICEVGVRTQHLESRTGDYRRNSGAHIGFSSAGMGRVALPGRSSTTLLSPKNEPRWREGGHM